MFKIAPTFKSPRRLVQAENGVIFQVKFAEEGRDIGAEVNQTVVKEIHPLFFSPPEVGFYGRLHNLPAKHPSLDKGKRALANRRSVIQDSCPTAGRME